MEKAFKKLKKIVDGYAAQGISSTGHIYTQNTKLFEFSNGDTWETVYIGDEYLYDEAWPLPFVNVAYIDLYLSYKLVHGVILPRVKRPPFSCWEWF